MRIRRSVMALALMMTMAGAFLAAATAMMPAYHSNTSHYVSVHDVAIGSVTTSAASPDVHYDT